MTDYGGGDLGGLVDVIIIICSHCEKAAREGQDNHHLDRGFFGEGSGGEEVFEQVLFKGYHDKSKTIHKADLCQNQFSSTHNHLTEEEWDSGILVFEGARDILSERGDASA